LLTFIYPKLSTSVLAWLLCLALVLLGVFVYWPGMQSLFLFDDFPNLAPLEYLDNAGPAAAGFREFVWSGASGPLGRPVSLLTFALQADHWPADPAAFKWVNLGLHLLAGMLVFAVVSSLARLAGVRSRAAVLVIGGTTSALWLLHPVQTATVLYTVQRMTLLSSIFMLAALQGYLILRIRYFASWRKGGFFLGSAVCAVLVVAALLSKEVAGSLVFYGVALEFTLLARLRTNRAFTLGRKALPFMVVLLALWFVVQLPELQQTFASRFGYGPMQRLLTESRILWYYLLHLLLPSQATTGIFVDFTPSVSLLAPVNSLLAVLGWCGLALLAILKRRQYPVPAFALFWFLGGHVLESTVLPLELVFNHRNYLPMLGPLFLLVWWVREAMRWVASHKQLSIDPRVLPGLLMVWFIALGVQTWMTARLWHQPLELALVWYSANPDTQRNAEFFANQLAATGAVDQAMQVYAAMLEKEPNRLRPYLSYLILSCYRDPGYTLSPEYSAAGIPEPQFAETDLLGPLRQLHTLVRSGTCQTAAQIELQTLFALTTTHASDEERGFIIYEQAQALLDQNDEQAALQLMSTAWELTRDPGIVYNQADLLIRRGEEARALELVDLGLQQLTLSNRIATGTRESKQQRLTSMRDYLLANQR